MVSEQEAVISSTVTSGLTAASMFATRYILEGSAMTGDPVMQQMAAAVFTVSFVLSYGGMTGRLPI